MGSPNALQCNTNILNVAGKPYAANYPTIGIAVVIISLRTRSIAIVWQQTPRLAKNEQSQCQTSSE